MSGSIKVLEVTGVPVCGVHVRVMDFGSLRRVAEKRIKAALGKSDAGKMCFCRVFLKTFLMETVCTERHRDIKIKAAYFTYK